MTDKVNAARDLWLRYPLFPILTHFSPNGERKEKDAMGTLLSGRKILIVEDSFHLAEVLSDILVELGCQVIGPTAHVSGALRLLAEQEIHGAILDINLGNDRSFAVADWLAERGAPFVFLTGHTNLKIIPARFVGVGVLPKPFYSQQVEREATKAFAPA